VGKSSDASSLYKKYDRVETNHIKAGALGVTFQTGSD
jgi:hypothetical protein